MLAWLLKTKGGSVVTSLTLREIIDGCRGERREGGEEEEMWVTCGCEEKWYVMSLKARRECGHV